MTDQRQDFSGIPMDLLVRQANLNIMAVHAMRDAWARGEAWGAARNAWAAAWGDAAREKQREIFISYLQPEAQPNEGGNIENSQDYKG